MEYDDDKVDDVVLALLGLTICEGDDWGARGWKSHDWDALDRLHAKGIYRRPEEQSEIGGAEPRGIDPCAKVVPTALRAKSYGLAAAGRFPGHRRNLGLSLIHI